MQTESKSILVVSYWTKFMTMTELMPLLRQLSRAEKLHIMQCLVSDLAQDESDLLRQDMSYPVWSPYDAFKAADTMLKVLAV